MKVLGITNGHDSAVSLVVDGKLLGSVATERVTRQKKDKYLCFW